MRLFDSIYNNYHTSTLVDQSVGLNADLYSVTAIPFYFFDILEGLIYLNCNLEWSKPIASNGTDSRRCLCAEVLGRVGILIVLLIGSVFNSSCVVKVASMIVKNQ